MFVNRKNNEIVTDFGERQLNKQNKSRTVVLPRTALKNCGIDLDENTKVNVSLVQSENDSYIIIEPVCKESEDDDEDEDKDDDKEDE